MTRIDRRSEGIEPSGSLLYNNNISKFYLVKNILVVYRMELIDAETI